MRDERPVPAPPFDHFGLLAPLYERLIRPPDPAHLLTLLAPQPDDYLLDVGGGTGRVTQFFRGKVRRICILDASVGMLRQAQLKGGLGTCVGQAERLPFRQGSFQRILAVDSVHHFRHQARAAQELYRLLAPGGRIVIEEPNIELWAVKIVALLERVALMRSRFYRPEALAHLFEAQGGRVRLLTDPPPNYWVVVEKPVP